MMHTDLLLPLPTSQLWTLALFIGALSAFHVYFFIFHPLTPVGWKRIDYVWLSMAFFGILGTVASNRIGVANEMLVSGQARVSASRDLIISRLGVDLAICSILTRSGSLLLTEEFGRIREDVDRRCAWFTKVGQKLEAIDAANRTPIALDKVVGVRPKIGDGSVYESLDQRVSSYNASLYRMVEIEQSTKPSLFERLLQYFAPSILAIALALRMTRVSWEIQVERDKSDAS